MQMCFMISFFGSQALKGMEIQTTVKSSFPLEFAMWIDNK